MKNLLLLSFSLGISFIGMNAADVVTSIPMETDGLSRIKEKISHTNLKVYGRHTDENMPGAIGDALRFDGYSTFVEGEIPAFAPEGASSFSIWVAPETYPVVVEDQATTEKITLAGTIDHATHKGWAFSLSKTGKYSFDCYEDGWLINLEATDLLPCYEWSFLVAVNDPQAGTLTLYRNGEKVKEVKSLGLLGNDNTKINIGKTAENSSSAYLVKAFNGLIDDIAVYDGALSAEDMNITPENAPDLIVSKERFASDLLRPKYHGMPSANWTNETHGMTYSDGKYHLFFQKNANGPYMTRLHWGHLTSENLYDWTEEKIAIAPSESYDTKGAWSGCVFTDEEITGSLPAAVYTGVDYEKAYMVMALPTDESLIDWEKKGVIVNGRPAGLSDDFRDPYFFRNGNNAYLIVGTAKNGIGATTLHKYNPATGMWSNDGSIFFAGTSKDAHGTFWEMPNITPMDNGKWLFTVTPQATAQGVKTLCWVGEIAADGTFIPDTETSQGLELISREGYGLLSPTIYQKDGKTLLLGIVPDKLALSENLNLGWAHLYSFPREISLDEKGNLLQKPFSGLSELRDGKGYEVKDLSLDGVHEITGVSGRQLEVKGVFTVGSVPFGFNIFKNSKGQASITYTPATNTLEVNLSKLNRKVNDNIFSGKYTCQLPEKPEPGSELIIDAYIDGSILDLFINDKWATSIRIFPTDKDADGVEAFSTGGNVNVKSLNAWILNSDGNSGNNGDNEGDDTGIDEIINDLPEYVNVYNLGGVVVKRNVRAPEALQNLPKGIYVIGSHKIAVR